MCALFSTTRRRRCLSQIVNGAATDSQMDSHVSQRAMARPGARRTTTRPRAAPARASAASAKGVKFLGSAPTGSATWTRASAGPCAPSPRSTSSMAAGCQARPAFSTPTTLVAFWTFIPTRASPRRCCTPPSESRRPSWVSPQCIYAAVRGKAHGMAQPGGSWRRCFRSRTCRWRLCLSQWKLCKTPPTTIPGGRACTWSLPT
mmetsp:Transcript_16542/g.31707  ORF Transcript_16542/g.31707 Transcript_16542/m.31707 type:complete len:203 (-) Transcript_16542:1122-1730(-)